MRRMLSVLWLAAPGLAAAVPTTVQHQGRLFDDAGDPLDGTYSVEFSVFDVGTGGTARWTETQNVTFDAGYFSVSLGAVTAFDSTVANGDGLWLDIAVDSGAPLDERLPLGSVPYAVTAGALAGVPTPKVYAGTEVVGVPMAVSDTGIVMLTDGMYGRFNFATGMPGWAVVLVNGNPNAADYCWFESSDCSGACLLRFPPVKNSLVADHAGGVFVVTGAEVDGGPVSANSQITNGECVPRSAPYEISASYAVTTPYSGPHTFPLGPLHFGP